MCGGRYERTGCRNHALVHKKLGILLVALIGAGVVRPLPAPAIEPAGDQATTFVTFEVDVPADARARIRCDSTNPMPSAQVFADIAETYENGTSRLTQAYSGGVVVAGGAHLAGEGADTFMPPETVFADKTITWSLGRYHEDRHVLAAVAVFNAGDATCRMTVDGEREHGTARPSADARILWTDDFGGTANARLSPVGGVVQNGAHEEEVTDAVLTAVFDPYNFTNIATDPDPKTFEGKVTEPGGRVVETDYYWAAGGPAGTWKFELSGAVLGEVSPSLWIMKLPPEFVDQFDF